MRVLIPAVSFSNHLSGIQRHALNLAQCLSRRDEVKEIHFVVAPWQTSLEADARSIAGGRVVTHIAAVHRDSFSRNRWFYREVGRMAAQLRIDIIHLSYPVPVDASTLRCPTVVTLHDWYPYEIPMNFGFPKFFVNRFILQQCLRSVTAIACVSETTMRGVLRYGSASLREKATVIHNIVATPTAPSSHAPSSHAPYSHIPSARWSHRPFLLCVAQHRRNKNLPLLLRSFVLLTAMRDLLPALSLTIVGIEGPETSRIKALIVQLGLSDRVHLVEGLTEPELQWCYFHCEVLVSTASFEGFGLAVAEARRAGCRVVCSDLPVHREVGDGACIFVPLGKRAASAFARALVVSLNSPRCSPMPHSSFSPESAAEKYVALYQRLRINEGAANLHEAAGEYVAPHVHP